MKTSGNTILITGGASGIGRELAERFQAQGNTVIIAGRRRDRLDAVTEANPGMVGYVLDIEDKTGIDAFAATVIAAHPDLNVLINNAGIMLFEDLTRSRDLADAEAMVTTNLLGPIRLTNALIDHLSAQPDAAVVNVSSGLAFVPLVSTPTYSATKAAIHSYTVSLRDALKGRGRGHRARAARRADGTHARPVDAGGIHAPRRLHGRGDDALRDAADPAGNPRGTRGIPALRGKREAVRPGLGYRERLRQQGARGAALTLRSGHASRLAGRKDAAGNIRRVTAS